MTTPLKTVVTTVAILFAAFSTSAASTASQGSPPTHVEGPVSDEKGQPSQGVESPLLESLTTIVKSQDFTLTWGGRIQVDAGFFHGDDEYPVDDDDGTEVRRARLGVQARLYDSVDFKAEYDFAGGLASFTDVLIAYDTSIGKVEVGHMKIPLGLEHLTSSRFTTFMERSFAVEEVRDTGIMTSNTIDDATNWALGVFRRTNNFGNDTGEGEYAAYGRLTHAWKHGDGDILHLGLAAGERAGLPDERLRFRPEAHLLDEVFDTGSVSSDGSHLYAAEAAWVNGPFSLQSEYALLSLDEVDGGADADFSGWYAFASWFLTGESRNYKAKGGKFDRVKPQENYAGHGLGGAWEAALRYSNFDGDDGQFGTTTNGITAGLNWYLNPNARIMFNLIRSNVEDDLAGTDGDLTAFMVRFQVDW